MEKSAIIVLDSSDEEVDEHKGGSKKKKEKEKEEKKIPSPITLPSIKTSKHIKTTPMKSKLNNNKAKGNAVEATLKLRKPEWNKITNESLKTKDKPQPKEDQQLNNNDKEDIIIIPTTDKLPPTNITKKSINQTDKPTATVVSEKKTTSDVKITETNCNKSILIENDNFVDMLSSNGITHINLIDDKSDSTPRKPIKNGALATVTRTWTPPITRTTTPPSGTILTATAVTKTWTPPITRTTTPPSATILTINKPQKIITENVTTTVTAECSSERTRSRSSTPHSLILKRKLSDSSDNGSERSIKRIKPIQISEKVDHSWVASQSPVIAIDEDDDGGGGGGAGAQDTLSSCSLANNNTKVENPNDIKINDNQQSTTNGEQESIHPIFAGLLNACRQADPTTDMENLIKNKLLKYYHSVHPDFVVSKGFCRTVKTVTEEIKTTPQLVYYKLRNVVEELKIRRKSNETVVSNEEITTTGSEKKDQHVKRLSRALYRITKRITKLEQSEADLDSDNSSYLICERYKKRACEIYEMICDLTGESKHAHRLVKKPISFKATSYPEFNRTLQAFVNRTNTFPDYYDVYKCLDHCNRQYGFDLSNIEIRTIAQDAFVKIGKLLQNRRKTDLYETVSHFTGCTIDPAESDPILNAKLKENQKYHSRISTLIDRFANQQDVNIVETDDDNLNNDKDEEKINNTKSDEARSPIPNSTVLNEEKLSSPSPKDDETNKNSIENAIIQDLNEILRNSPNMDNSYKINGGEKEKNSSPTCLPSPSSSNTRKSPENTTVINKKIDNKNTPSLSSTSSSASASVLILLPDLPDLSTKSSKKNDKPSVSSLDPVEEIIISDEEDS